MSKSIKFYVMGIVIIVVSVFIFSYTSTQHKQYNPVTIYEWDVNKDYTRVYEEMEVIYLYTNDDYITSASIVDSDPDGAPIDVKKELQLYDSLDDKKYTMQFNHISQPQSKVFYYDMTWANTEDYKGFRLIGKLIFQAGVTSIDLDRFYSGTNNPFISTDEIITTRTLDYSQYNLIPLITGGVGLMVLLLTFVTKSRSYNYDTYSQSNHRSKSRKREKY